jgi:hypothetical protein
MVCFLFSGKKCADYDDSFGESWLYSFITLKYGGMRKRAAMTDCGRGCKCCDTIPPERRRGVGY